MNVAQVSRAVLISALTHLDPSPAAAETDMKSIQIYSPAQVNFQFVFWEILWISRGRNSTSDFVATWNSCELFVKWETNGSVTLPDNETQTDKRADKMCTEPNRK